MKIIIQSYSTTGVRPQNEDAMDYINNLDGSDKTNIKILYMGIYDGHGGGNISKTLIDKDKINMSKYFCNIISPIATKLCQNKTFNQKFIVPLFLRIQEKLKNFYIHSNKMGSTALITLIYPRSEKQNNLLLKVINLGDSRAIMCSEYNISIPLTLDHKPNLLCDKDRIIKMGGTLEFSEGDDPRINGMSVSRSFGDLDNTFISQTPDVFDYNLSSEKFIIMGCDGIWDVLNNQDAVDYVLEKYQELKLKNKSLSNLKSKSEANIAQKLGDYAITKGSQDNISVSIIFLTNNLN
jgi:serine/threonine protein phosphatase PrpC